MAARWTYLMLNSFVLCSNFSACKCRCTVVVRFPRGGGGPSLGDRPPGGGGGPSSLGWGRKSRGGGGTTLVGVNNLTWFRVGLHVCAMDCNPRVQLIHLCMLCMWLSTWGPWQDTVTERWNRASAAEVHHASCLRIPQSRWDHVPRALRIDLTERVAWHQYHALHGVCQLRGQLTMHLATHRCRPRRPQRCRHGAQSCAHEP